MDHERAGIGRSAGLREGESVARGTSADEPVVELTRASSGSQIDRVCVGVGPTENVSPSGLALGPVTRPRSEALRQPTLMISQEVMLWQCLIAPMRSAASSERRGRREGYQTSRHTTQLRGGKRSINRRAAASATPSMASLIASVAASSRTWRANLPPA